MREAEKLRAEVNSTLDGDPWFGPPVLGVLRDVNAAAAASRPIPDAHSVWEIVLHMMAWTKETVRRLRGAAHGPPPEGDWPMVGRADPAAWHEALADLRRAHEELACTLADLEDPDLGRQVGGAQTDSQGNPVTLYRTVIGLLQHDAYHAGQIALLKKLVVSKKGRSA